MKYSTIGAISNFVEDKPLTTIASVILDNSILFACDSQETEENKLTTSVHKLHELTPTLVCALSGELSVIREYVRVIKPYCAEANNLKWSELREYAVDQLNLLNKKKRRSMSDAGVEATADDLGDVLFGGYLDNEPRILQITDKGEVYLWDENNRHVAIGSGANNFMMAKITLEAYLGQEKKQVIFNKDYFRLFMGLAIHTDPMSGMPMRLVEINSKEVIWHAGQE